MDRSIDVVMPIFGMDAHLLQQTKLQLLWKI